jgi:hypothetical protein
MSKEGKWVYRSYQYDLKKHKISYIIDSDKAVNKDNEIIFRKDNNFYIYKE